MSRLTTKQRKNLAASTYVYPKQRKYPIPDRSHARAALAYAKRKDTFGSYSKVRAAVARKFPDMVKKRKKTKKR